MTGSLQLFSNHTAFPSCTHPPILLDDPLLSSNRPNLLPSRSLSVDGPYFPRKQKHQKRASTSTYPPQLWVTHGPSLLTVQMSTIYLCTWSHPLSNPKGYPPHLINSFSIGSLSLINMLFSNSIPSSSNCSISSYLCS